jgi:hypothetical protein
VRTQRLLGSTHRAGGCVVTGLLRIGGAAGVVFAAASLRRPHGRAQRRAGVLLAPPLCEARWLLDERRTKHTMMRDGWSSKGS